MWSHGLNIAVINSKIKCNSADYKQFILQFIKRPTNKVAAILKRKHCGLNNGHVPWSAKDVQKYLQLKISLYIHC